MFIVLDDMYFNKRTDGRNGIIIFNHNWDPVWYDPSYTKTYASSVGNLLCSNDENGIIFEMGSSKIVSTEIEFMEWKVAGLTKNNESLTKQKTLLLLILLIFMLNFLVAFIFVRFAASRLSDRILSLTSLMEKYKSSNEKNMPLYMEEHRKRDITIRERLFYYLVISTLVPVSIFGMLIFIQSKKFIEDEMIKENLAIFEKSYNKINEYMYRKHMVLQKFSFGELEKELKRRYKEGSSSLNITINDLANESIYLGLQSEIILIYDASGNLLLSSAPAYQISQKDDLHKYLGANKTGIIWYPGKSETNRYYITLLMPVFPLDGSLQVLGHIRMDIDNSALAEQYSDLRSYNTEAFIVDEKAKIISHYNTDMINKSIDIKTYDSDKDQPGKILKNSEGTFIAFMKKLDFFSWYFIYKYNYKDIARQSFIMLLNNVYIFIIILLLVIILSYLLSYIILSPINKLNSMLEKISLDTLDKRFFYEILSD